MVGSTETGSILLEYALKISLYTLGMIGLMYLAYFYYRGKQNGQSGLLNFSGLFNGSGEKLNVSQPIEIEATLTLQPRKTVHILRTGSERFLLASTENSVQLISRLENADTLENSSVTNIQTVEQLSLGNNSSESTTINRDEKLERLVNPVDADLAKRARIHTWLKNTRPKSVVSSSPFSLMLQQVLNPHQNHCLSDTSEISSETAYTPEGKRIKKPPLNPPNR